jgi:hypothetical protein
MQFSHFHLLAFTDPLEAPADPVRLPDRLEVGKCWLS